MEPQLGVGIPAISYEYLGEVVTIEAARWGLAVFFLLFFTVFLVTLIITTYHLRRYSLTRGFALRAQVMYLVVGFIPLVVMLSILMRY